MGTPTYIHTYLFIKWLDMVERDVSISQGLYEVSQLERRGGGGGLKL